jgi:SAM-dependent methyltransferase
MNDLHESNRACWNEWAEWWRRKADQRDIWRECHRDPTLVLSPSEMRFLSDVSSKDVCVLGSGDNEVVFALAGMGARVTSVDISERQLDVARERAEILGLDVSFMRADVTDLASIPEGSFDLAYTGGHMSVWISDLHKYYGEAVRVLRPRGLFIVNDYHPVRRMWHESDGPTPRHRYFHRGPYEYRTKEGHSQVEFHWTVADHVQAVLDAGCALLKVDERGECKEEEDYSKWVPAALPMYLLIVGRKEASNNRVRATR